MLPLQFHKFSLHFPFISFHFQHRAFWLVQNCYCFGYYWRLLCVKITMQRDMQRRLWGVFCCFFWLCVKVAFSPQFPPKMHSCYLVSGLCACVLCGAVSNCLFFYGNSVFFFTPRLLCIFLLFLWIHSYIVIHFETQQLDENQQGMKWGKTHFYSRFNYKILWQH